MFFQLFSSFYYNKNSKISKLNPDSKKLSKKAPGKMG
jgi:hypothetical protein